MVNKENARFSTIKIYVNHCLDESKKLLVDAFGRNLQNGGLLASFLMNNEDSDGSGDQSPSESNCYSKEKVAKFLQDMDFRLEVF